MASDQHIPQEPRDQEIDVEKVPFPDEFSSENSSEENPMANEFGKDETLWDAAPEITIDARDKVEDSTALASPVDDTGHDNSAFDDLMSQFMEAKQQVEEQRDNALRLQAEMENLRRRSAREVENAHKYGLDRFVSELLPVKDSLELGVAAATTDENVNVNTMREGMELTLKMLGNAMEKFGVEEVSPSQGERFDPERHQAMSVQEDKEKESGTISMVMQKGYLLNGRLARPAMVIVVK
uniref:Protein GrpE n=1 Tax=Candidatus Kentrum sp. SD TaxID=2126332 RepID=A0A451BQJ1_9GAMM|nr:MAG: molecular chaperone GrpE [Candidatus Kentron sp. SD]